MNKKVLLLVHVLLLTACLLSGHSYGEKISDESYKLSKEKQKEVYKEHQDIIIAPPPPPLEVYNLPSISFVTKDDEPHFVKMTLALGYEKNDELARELKDKSGEIIHIINPMAREMVYEYLNTVKGKIMFSEDIKAHINVRLISGRIKEVYFKEFVIN